MSRSRCFVFTINNYTEDDLSLLATLNYQYIITGYEGNDRTSHIQGYVYLKNPMTFTAIKKFMPRAHIEIKSPNSTHEQAIEYCKKEGSYDDDGKPPIQGKRTDLDLVAEMVKNKSSLKEIAQTYPVTYIKFYRGIERLRDILTLERTSPPEIIVYYGETGAGKSRTARDITNEPYVWNPALGTWFDGYDGETDVIFEEFRGQLPFGLLLSLLDRYTVKVQTKGGTRKFIATKIVFTSPLHPRKWYKSLSYVDNYNQLERRINTLGKIIFLTNNKEENACPQDILSETSEDET